MRFSLAALSAFIFLTTVAQPRADEAKFEECRLKLVKAQDLGVLYDLKMKAPRFEVVVGETFFQMPYDAKKGFVDTVNCWVREASSDRTMLPFTLIYWQTGKRVGEFSIRDSSSTETACVASI